jgi:hypothetical protein
VFLYVFDITTIGKHQKIKYICYVQGSPHLQKTGRLDFSLREHEGEVKA